MKLYCIWQSTNGHYILAHGGGLLNENVHFQEEMQKEKSSRPSGRLQPEGFSKIKLILKKCYWRVHIILDTLSFSTKSNYIYCNMI